MKITETLNESEELEEIKISEGAKTLRQIRKKLQGIKKVHTLDARGVKSLVSLEGLPPNVKVNNLLCNYTSITSLKGCPKELGMLWCDGTSITSLKGCPKKLDALWCDGTLITSLKGCPKELDKLWCDNTLITSLKDGPERVGNISCSYNSHLIMKNVWEDLHYCEEYVQFGMINSKSGLLGLLRVKGLKKIGGDDSNSKSPLEIVAKYIPLKSMSDIMRCKQELINVGFKSNAKF